MSDVYYIKNPSSDYRELGFCALSILKRILIDKEIKLEKDIPIKVHFGERGNETFIPPISYDPIIDYLKEEDKNPFFIESNVLYRGARTTRTSHIKTARDHGFTKIPIVIADGEIGSEYEEISINKEYFKKCKIGREYGKYRQFLVMSHFKGHGEAGFGGALKQLAMGFASRGGKLDQHSGINPFVNEGACVACGECLEACDFDAITIDSTAHIDDDLCTGCAGCIAVCDYGAIQNRWDGTNFLEKLAEYAYGASLNKEIIYISFVSNITKDCDCFGRKMDLVAGNLGILASLDPIALDAACLDLVQENEKKKLFDKGRATLKHGQKIGLGSIEYSLRLVEK